MAAAASVDGAGDGLGNVDPRGGVGVDDPPPGWLSERRRCVDSQVQRRQLRSRRADEIVARQFHTVLAMSNSLLLPSALHVSTAN